MLSWSTSQTTGIYDYAFRQVCATFGIDKFQGEQQKAIDMFFEGNDVSVSLPTGQPRSPSSSCETIILRNKRQRNNVTKYIHRGNGKTPPTFNSLVVRKFILRIEKFSGH